MKAQTIKLRHLYDLPSLYRLLWGQQPQDAVTDAIGACVLTEHWLVQHADQFKFMPSSASFAKGINGLRICELFAGDASMHELHFRKHFSAPVHIWTPVDRIEGAPLGSFDITVDSIPVPSGSAKYDVALALYHSASIILDGDVAVSRKTMVSVFRNVMSGLRKHGLFIIDTTDSYFEYTYGSVTEDYGTDPHPIVVPNGSDLRKALNLPILGVRVYLEYMPTYSYDRATATSFCRFKGPIKIFCNDVLTHSITVREPFIMRMWTESELVSIAREAGFSHDYYPLSVYDEHDTVRYAVGNMVETEETAHSSVLEDLIPHKLGFLAV